MTMGFGIFGGKEKMPTPIEFDDMLEKLDDGLLDALDTLKKGVSAGGFSSDPAARAVDKNKISQIAQSVEGVLQNKKLTLVGANSVEDAITSWIYSDGAVAESSAAPAAIDAEPDIQVEAPRADGSLEMSDGADVENLVEEESLSDAEIDDLIARITKATNEADRTRPVSADNVVPIHSEEVSPHTPKEDDDLEAFFKKGQDPHNLKGGQKDAA